MRVIMFPSIGVKNENRYLDILVQAMREIGIDVQNWTKHLSFQKGDVFHIHWPEIIPEIRGRKNNFLRGEWICHQFFQTIRRIKKSGGRVVWTVHDIYPHSASARNDPYLKKFMKRFISETDVFVSLSNAGIGQIKSTFPSLEHAQFCVAHHPHYRGILKKIRDDEEMKKRFGIRQGQKVFSFLGTLRPNKRPDVLAEAFKALPTDSYFLLMAGAGKQDISDPIQHALSSCTNVRLDFRQIPEQEMPEFYAATDVLVFPGTDYFNSGTIYTALSLDIPVLAAWTPTNAEIQGLVGKRWMYLYTGELTSKVLGDAATALDKEKNAVCDLSALDPLVCAQEHRTAYTVSLAKR